MLESAESTIEKSGSGSPVPGAATGLRSAMEQATLGATMVVKGEVSGSQAFYVDGRIEGSIHFPNHRVTIGRGAVVQATIEAKEVVIMGTVTGNIDCGDRVDIRSDAVFTGDVTTQRISIDEGALVKGSVEVRKTHREPLVESSAAKTEAVGSPKPASQPAAAAPSAASEPLKSAAAAAPAGPRSTFRVSGSRVLFEEQKS